MTVISRKKVSVIVQARMGSSRLPGKVMLPLGSKTLISFLLDRIALAKTIDEVIVAMPDTQRDQTLKTYLEDRACSVYVGSESDVLARYYETACTFRAEVIVRITADCPLTDPALVDKLVSTFLKLSPDYCSNVFPPTYPDGFDVEVFSFAALKKIFLKERNAYAREHVTIALRNGEFTLHNVAQTPNLSSTKLSVDTKQDYDRVCRVVSKLQDVEKFSWFEAFQKVGVK